MNDTIQQIPLDHLYPTTDNRLVGGFDPVKLEQLAGSIRAIGVQQPAVVRIHPSASPGNFEIVAGERRWKAAAIAGLAALPCIVRELDDVACLRIRLIENLQREDVHPLDEADGYARLIEKAGYDVERLAKEIDKSISYVYQRLKLRELIPPARKLLVDGVIQAGHAILIARLPPGQQEQVLKHHSFHRDDYSVRDVALYIQREVLLDLDSAAFKKHDPDLDPKAGPCAVCPKRTGYQPELFADVYKDKKHDYCTDSACYHGKTAALVQRRRLELEEIGGKHLEVMDDYVDYREEQRLEKAGAVDRHGWEECKKSDPEAMPVLVVAGKTPGRITWGKRCKENHYGHYAPSAEEKEKRKKELLEAKIKAAVRRRTWDVLLAALDAKKVFSDISLHCFTIDALRLIATTYWKRNMDDVKAAYCQAMAWKEPPKKPNEYGHPWERMGTERIAAMNIGELFRFMLTITLAPDLEGPHWEYGEGRVECKRLKEVAALYQVDINGIEAEVKKEFQEKARRAKAKAKKPRTTKAPAKKVTP